MTKKKSTKKSNSAESGYFAADFKKIMGRNDKILIGLVSGAILILLIVTGALLFGRGKQIDDNNANIPPEQRPIPTKAVTTPYPTIPVTKDFTVMINENRIYPAEFGIAKGNSVIFFNMGTTDMNIVPSASKDTMLNIGIIKSGEEKAVKFDTPGVYKFKNSAQKDQEGTITVN